MQVDLFKLISKYSVKDLASRIDYAILKNLDATKIHSILEEAEKLGVRAISTYFSVLRHVRGSTKLRIAVVIDFPHGTSHLESKIKAVEQALAHGADEVEFVVNVYAWLEGKKDYVVNEVKTLSRICNEVGATCKALIESSFLTPDELRELLEKIASLEPENRPHFVKMNTGWFSRGVRAYEVVIAAKTVKSKGIMVKAAGGIRDALYAIMLIELGADVIGSSEPQQLLNELEVLKRIS